MSIGGTKLPEPLVQLTIVVLTSRSPLGMEPQLDVCLFESRPFGIGLYRGYTGVVNTEKGRGVIVFGEFHYLVADIEGAEERFRRCGRVDEEQFEEVLIFIQYDIKREDTNYRESPAENGERSLPSFQLQYESLYVPIDPRGKTCDVAAVKLNRTNRSSRPPAADRQTDRQTRGEKLINKRGGSLISRVLAERAELRRKRPSCNGNCRGRAVHEEQSSEKLKPYQRPEGLKARCFGDSPGSTVRFLASFSFCGDS
ncbi:hypothetical protein J6590_079545 [Homalodisca vitripennis]|nr:hypothetical protein J6590_079545 [Homalodisca vitripennis]